MKYKLPTVRQYYTLKYSKDIEEILNVVHDIAGDTVNSVEDFKNFIEGYLSAIDLMRAGTPNYLIPYAPREKEEHYFECTTRDFKSVYEYTGLNFNDIWELPVFTFWEYHHDAVVYNCEQSESGRDYLEDAYNYQSTTPDRQGLREHFGGMRHGE